MNTLPFEAAYDLIDETFIESELSAPGAYWSKGRYFTLNPTRIDCTVRSFNLYKKDGRWFWHDFATNDGGDIFDLLAARDHCAPIETAKRILGRSKVLENFKARAPKKGKDASNSSFPVFALSQEECPLLPSGLEPSDPDAHRIGTTTRYIYSLPDGRLAFIIVREDKADGKRFCQWSMVRTDEHIQWVRKGWDFSPRPLYGIDRLKSNPGRPIVLVEGEKTATLLQTSIGTTYNVLTWSGGAQAWGKADFTPLAGHDLILWPDNDNPGYDAMEGIARKLKPKMKSVGFVYLHDRKEGWDAADALDEGENPRELLCDLRFIKRGD